MTTPHIKRSAALAVLYALALALWARLAAFLAPEIIAEALAADGSTHASRLLAALYKTWPWTRRVGST